VVHEHSPASRLRCTLCGRSPSVVVLRVVMPGIVLIVRGCADCVRSSAVDGAISEALHYWREEL